MAQEDEVEAWVRLHLAQGTGRPWAQPLVEHCGGAVCAAHADLPTLRRCLSAAKARSVHAALRRARPERIVEEARQLEQQVLTPAAAAWPRTALAGLVDAPCALFLRGRLPPPDAPALAIVGTRDASPYGLRVAGTLAGPLAARGCWIVSGFALGVDGAAHEAAVQVGGATLAVLGCGIDHDYPVAHEELRERVVRDGGLLSEFPPGVAPRRHHFPRRNRLVAALAQVVVVVEASQRSGSLITARLALEQGREVFAVPGSVFRATQAGCHELLRQGAALCTGPEDVSAALGCMAGGEPERKPPSDPHEAALYRALDDEEARDANALCLQTGLSALDVSVALTGLELSGHARRLPGVGYVRR